MVATVTSLTFVAPTASVNKALREHNFLAALWRPALAMLFLILVISMSEEIADPLKTGSRCTYASYLVPFTGY